MGSRGIVVAGASGEIGVRLGRAHARLRQQRGAGRHPPIDAAGEGADGHMRREPPGEIALDPGDLGQLVDGAERAVCRRWPAGG